MKVEVAVLGFASLISLTVSGDVKQHWTRTPEHIWPNASRDARRETFTASLQAVGLLIPTLHL